MSQKVALVTGASAGIGEATALALHDLGFTVYGGARRVERMRPLEQRGVRTLALDVTDERSAREAVDRILIDTGRIDLLVNNAGYGSYGAVEEVPIDEGRRQFEVNLFGAARLIQLVLPAMREQRSGRIVNVSSVGGKIHTPMGAWYHATKFALEGFSDALRTEVADFGIDVVVIEPGAIRTEWGGIALDRLRAVSGQGAYAPLADAVASAMSDERMADRASPPSSIAMVIGRAASTRRPRTRYAAGFGAKPLLALRRVLPDRAFDALVRRALR
ncbi:oxidoreductase [Streptomyces sp. NPDC057638]|uniref:oxidoreductase n=1 Tax=Streptomyces sp. NPDC057638 TaxID=3346190 RepID=UPI0036D0D03C